MKAYEGCVELLRIARSIAILAILLSFLTDIDTNMEYSVIHIICRLIFRYQSKIKTPLFPISLEGLYFKSCKSRQLLAQQALRPLRGSE